MTRKDLGEYGANSQPKIKVGQPISYLPDMTWFHDIDGISPKLRSKLKSLRVTSIGWLRELSADWVKEQPGVGQKLSAEIDDLMEWAGPMNPTLEAQIRFEGLARSNDDLLRQVIDMRREMDSFRDRLRKLEGGESD